MVAELALTLWAVLTAPFDACCLHLCCLSHPCHYWYCRRHPSSLLCWQRRQQHQKGFDAPALRDVFIPQYLVIYCCLATCVQCSHILFGCVSLTDYYKHKGGAGKELLTVWLTTATLSQPSRKRQMQSHLLGIRSRFLTSFLLPVKAFDCICSCWACILPF